MWFGVGLKHLLDGNELSMPGALLLEVSWMCLFDQGIWWEWMRNEFNYNDSLSLSYEDRISEHLHSLTCWCRSSQIQLSCHHILKHILREFHLSGGLFLPGWWWASSGREVCSVVFTISKACFIKYACLGVSCGVLGKLGSRSIFIIWYSILYIGVFSQDVAFCSVSLKVFPETYIMG